MALNLAVVLAGAAAALIIATPAAANGPVPPFSFRAWEGQQHDPLTGSNPAWTHVYHTPAEDLADIHEAIAAFVPVETSRQEAVTRLQRVGAHCRPAPDGAELCTWHASEPVDEYLDYVTWTVRLDMAGDAVTALSLDRSWQRH